MENGEWRIENEEWRGTTIKSDQGFRVVQQDLKIFITFAAIILMYKIFYEKEIERFWIDLRDYRPFRRMRSERHSFVAISE
jgi:hypothetical protein